MLNLGNLGVVFALNVAGALSPGPDVFLILRLAARNRAHAFAAVFGICTALILWATLSVSGASVVMNRYPWLLHYVQILGATWLLYMAYGLFQSVRAHYTRVGAGGHTADIDMGHELGTWWQSYRTGMVTNLSNPKAVLYFMAILAPLLPVGEPWWVGGVYVVATLLTAFLCHSLLAFFVSTTAVRRRLLSVTHLVDAVAGAVFATFACALLVEGIAGLV